MKQNRIANPVVVARDGEEALDWLVGSRATEFGLVLLDLRLPKMHGLEVLKRVRNDPRTRLTPVVILTASREEIDVIKGYTLQANSYIAKPVEFGRFVEAVCAMGVYWLQLNEAPPQRVGVAASA